METVMWSVRIVIMIYLVIMAVTDIKKKAIPLLPGVIVLFIISVAVLVCTDNFVLTLTGAGVGLFLYAVSRLSRGGIGEADALVYVITGVCLGFYHNLELLVISLLMAAFFGGILMIVKKVGRKYRMPFVPFTLAGYILVLFGV